MLRLERLVFFLPLLLRLGAGDLLDLRILFPAPLRSALEPFERGLELLLCRLMLLIHGDSHGTGQPLGGCGKEYVFYGAPDRGKRIQPGKISAADIL